MLYMPKYLVAALLSFSAAIIMPIAASADNATETSFSATGDAAKGQRVFNRCKACHNLTTTTRTRLGPNLDNLFGKKVGTAESYKYSRALSEADFIWTEAKLNEWLLKPSAFLPGNKMTFAGLRQEKDRKDLIAYLRRATVKTD